MPSEIRGKNVEEIIAGWTAELEERSRAFMRHAGALAAWDRHIMAGRRKVRRPARCTPAQVTGPHCTVVASNAVTVRSVAVQARGFRPPQRPI